MTTPPAEVPVVWLAPAPGPERAQSAAASLTAWARAHGVGLGAPHDPAVVTTAADMTVAGNVEDKLDAAREAMATGATAEGESAVASAEELVRAHPELPNAPWLMAEVLRLRSAALRRAIGPGSAGTGAEADRAWTAAAAIDGGRAPGAGELGTTPTTGSPASATETSLRLEHGRALDGTQVWVDAAAVAGASVTLRAGLHAVVVTWRAAPRWATWVDVPATGATLSLAELDAPACSATDLADAHLAASPGQVVASARCPRWIAAATDAHGALWIAECAAERCANLAAWHEAPVWSSQAPRRKGARWPAWATWAVVGGGAVVVGGVVTAVVLSTQTGAHETRWVLGPVRVP